MELDATLNATQLRRELALRNRGWSRGRLHVESYGGDPVIVYAPELPADEDASPAPHRSPRHGNFFDAAYAAILAHPQWMKRFNKVHAQGRLALPKLVTDPARRWRELDSCISSDALLMNVFCTPAVVESEAVRRTLGIDPGIIPEFGWKARVPLRNGLVDRTEVDMRLGSLLVEAKLTETDFQARKAEVVESYRDFDLVFERELLPRAPIVLGRRKDAVEFPEDYSQEYEPAVLDPGFSVLPCRRPAAAVEPGYASYQLIRNTLAACAHGCSFCVVHDERRPDLREAWFRVIAAVKSAEMRVRLKVLTWQELAALLPEDLQDFLDIKYGIVPPGKVTSSVSEDHIVWNAR
jgi:hypothetical protein